MNFPRCPKCWFEIYQESVCPRCGLLCFSFENYWNGEPLKKPLLILAPNSYGDCFERARHVEALTIPWNLVVLDNLVSFFKKNFPEMQVHSYNSPTPEFEYWIDLLTGLGKRNEIRPPYKRFHSSPEAVEKHKDIPHPAVGIAYKAAEKYEGRHFRSISNKAVQQIISSLPEFNWVSLEYSETTPNCLNPDCRAWDSMAGLIANLDAVVTVDSAPAYLALSMGKPTAVLFGAYGTYFPDFRAMYTGAPFRGFFPDYDGERVRRHSHEQFIEWARREWIPCGALVAANRFTKISTKTILDVPVDGV